ncbi:hypothetical protein L486_00877 [Kwoniella mangroviensis CBS 10435]|uniref:C2 domain-containing protein n=1 Tax=Kwoniella mangroviensis CBS 10435 TaxID=1331196 RepID=A0A1B9J0B4_9TREE|nr:hypothetical protein L486_00877 [Kwoniella mangroviensis CBS 10435]
MSLPKPPPLPPRRPTPTPQPPHADTEPGPPISEPVAAEPPPLPSKSPSTSRTPDATKLAHDEADHPRPLASVMSDYIILPPPLPPRVPSVSKPIPEPILVNEGNSRVISNPVPIPDDPPTSIAIADGVLTSPSSSEVTSPVTVAITPATPPDSQPNSPTSPSSLSFGQSVEEMKTPRPPSPSDNADAGISQTPPRPVTDQREPHSSPVPPPLPLRKPNPPPLPLRNSRTTNVALSTVPTLGPMVWSISMVCLAYMRVSFVTLLIFGILGYMGMKKLEKTAEETLRKEEPEDPGASRSNRAAGKEAVEWLNHALYALFPLISTDVLTPFVDLMEDALAGQVPPVVTSVRLTSPALGSQPVLLTSLIPISDEEWFSSLSVPEEPVKNVLRKRERGKSENGKAKHNRNTSSVSCVSVEGSTEMNTSRSTTSSGGSTTYGADEQAKEAVRRRKRDKILQRVSRKGAPMDHQNKIDGSDDLRQHEQEQGVNGQRKHVGENNETFNMNEDDPNAGQYVNYQVGFEYRRSRDAEKKGRGLHCLAYFGWGIKGVAGSEIPVYIDVLSIKGIVNLRLLLSATPPFVRTGTFSFPKLPEYDVSAQPLKKGAFNAMELPGMKQYVKQSITEVASAFVSPQSYTLDLDRLLLGQESALRTTNIGVLRILIHSAEDLPKVDTMGSCDPYVSIGMSKYHKPVFSTRTIRDSRDPKWEEEAFVLVSSDAIEAGERLRIKACDSDRFSADDALGVVEVDISDLVDTHSSKLFFRTDDLKEDTPGMKCSGRLNWSVQFHGLWQMSSEKIKKRSMETNALQDDINPPEIHQVPFWMEMLSKIIDKNDEKWYKLRQEKRKETSAWFNGEKERDRLEAEEKPDEGYRSGILQFHVHQCIDLEVEPLSGTYSSHTTSRNSPAGGKPALESLTDRTPVENPDPPSSYCEVHLNDKLIYRTRTKQVTPLPYFNAVSERFVRDWTESKVVFVVRDERNREHDPILGIVVIPLKEAFKTRSQFTRWFPLVGGLGWGRIRISLLWKPLDMELPRGISGYEVATFRLKGLAFSSLGIGPQSEKGLTVILSTDSDKYELSTSSDQVSSSTTNTPTSARTSLERIQSPSKVSLDEEIEMEFDLSSKHVRLAMMYRHSCSLLVTLIQRSSVLKKKRIMGIGVVNLRKMLDGNGDCKIGIWGTENVEKVMRSQELLDQEDDDGTDEGEGRLMSPPLSVGVERKPSFRRRIAERRSWPDSPASIRERSKSISGSSINSTRTSRSGVNGVPLLGYAEVKFKIIPGVSRVHRKVAKRDMRFKRVYEVWESEREVEMGWDKMNEHSGSDVEEEDNEDEDGKRDLVDDSEDELEVEKKMSERRAHSHALHKRHKGIFQLKIARTGRYVKDKFSSKVYSAAHSGGNKDQSRSRGADLEVEREGISKM